MITFKTYLTEARLAPLYHATSPSKFRSIISDNVLVRGGEDRRHTLSKDGRQISMTRNFIFAAEWAPVVLEFDQQRLSQRYKIVPFNYFPKHARIFPYTNYGTTQQKGKNFAFDNQFEEAVLSDIKDPLKYVNKIYVSGDWLVDNIKNELPDKYKNIPVLQVSNYSRTKL